MATDGLRRSGGLREREREREGERERESESERERERERESETERERERQRERASRKQCPAWQPGAILTNDFHQHGAATTGLRAEIGT
jgi:Ni/Co efflux regulator RcnB